MENTQICEQIIKDFNGKKIPGIMSTYAWCFACYILFDNPFLFQSSPMNSQGYFLSNNNFRTNQNVMIMSDSKISGQIGPFFMVTLLRIIK